MLIRTFLALAAGNEGLLQLFQDLAGGLNTDNEADICDAVISLACENPQYPLTGDKLWAALVGKFPEGDDPPNFLGLLAAVQDQIGFLKDLQAQSAGRGTISTEPAVRALVG